MSDTKRIYRVKLRERIADESAEGRPAYPTFGFRSFGVILIALASVLMLVGGHRRLLAQGLRQGPGREMESLCSQIHTHGKRPYI